MGQTTYQIEDPIEKTRDNLGANLHELEKKVKDITDWRYHYRNNPITLLGLAFGGGVLLAGMVGGTRSGSRSLQPSPVSRKVGETWDHIRDALLGVAAARVSEYVGDMVPGLQRNSVIGFGITLIESGPNSAGRPGGRPRTGRSAVL
jgi:hypothetical protein